MIDRKERDRRYRDKYREKIAARNKAWREANKEILREKKRLQIESNPEYYKARDKRYRQTLVGKFHTLRGTARSKKLPVTLTINEFAELIAMPCAYCGEIELSRGIDRIDNTLGYTKENSAPACRPCNFLKKDTPLQDFLSHIEKIYKHNVKA